MRNFLLSNWPRGKFIFLFLIVISFGMINAYGEDSEGGSEWGFMMYPMGFWQFAANVDYEGFEIIEGTNTSVNLALGFGWDDFFYYKDESNQYVIPSLDQSDIDRGTSKQMDLYWIPGITQGLIWNDRIDDNLLAVYANYIGIWEKNFSIDEENPGYILSGTLPDKDGNQQNSLRVGFTYNDQSSNNHSVKQGLYANLSGEIAPSFLNTISDYYRIGLDVTYFIPLIDLKTEQDMNLFNLYFGNRLNVGWIDGNYISIYGRQTNQISVRGIENQRFDTHFTATYNSELRFQFPSLFLPEILPMINTYLDAGYFWEDEDYNGSIVSIGATVGINFFSFFYMGVRTDYLLVETRLSGEQWTPMAFNFSFQI